MMIIPEIFEDNFSEEAAHEPLPLDYEEADCKKLNQPFVLSELRVAISRTKSTSPGEDRIINAAFSRG